MTDSTRSYAARTKVSPDKSRDEIRRLVTGYGAERFATLDEPGRAVVLFEAHDRRVRFVLPLPDPSTARSKAAHEQALRQRWRALTLAIKAKLESVQSRIETFEEAFYAHVVMPNGATVYEQTHEQLARQLAEGGYQPLMLGAGGER
jgi:hypothetical protein